MNNNLSLLLKSGNSWLKFSHPLEIYVAAALEDIPRQLKALDHQILNGKYIAGFISYEAAPALDPALITRNNDYFPLMVFGVFNEPVQMAALPQTDEKFHITFWKASQTKSYYNSNIKKIKDYIEAGDTYQVNYTMRLSSRYKGSPYALFYQLCQNQDASYASYLEYDRFRICSVSPELFFSLSEDKILSRPMKGTAARGLSSAQDQQNRDELFNSAKERSENIMIVDMIRNDMGKICKAGTVKVDRLFNTERYPTVWQMTSDVRGTTQASFSEIIHALFPCASISGAPKARTMQIINELEQTPRHIYTGSIGWFSPQRQARFSVAIRTVLLDSRAEQAEYGVGSGIVWDSKDENEYEECLIKARVLTEKKIKFDLLETMLADSEGIFLLDYHLNRLSESAEYYNYPCNTDEIKAELLKITEKNSLLLKLRLLLSEAGTLTIEQYPLPQNDQENLYVAPAKNPVNSRDPFLYHKTTHRQVYQDAIEQAISGEVDDIILFNEKGEITESTIANIVIRKNNEFFTPPVSCGLLNGTFRQWLMDQQKLKEKILFMADIYEADGVFLINSVKKWQKVSFV